LPPPVDPPLVVTSRSKTVAVTVVVGKELLQDKMPVVPMDT